MSKKENSDKLAVLWTSADRDVALNMVFMYTLNGKLRGWWNEITLIVWGPSTKLLSQDRGLQDYMKKIIDSGVKVEACRACADTYGVSEMLEDLNIDVKYMGEPLTDLLKGDWRVMTV